MTVNKQAEDFVQRALRAANPLDYDRDTVARDMGDSAIFWGTVGAVAGLAAGYWRDVKARRKADHTKDTSVVDLPLTPEGDGKEKDASGAFSRVAGDLAKVPPAVWAATAGISTLAAYGGYRAGGAVYDTVTRTPGTKERKKLEKMFSKEYQRTRGLDKNSTDNQTEVQRQTANLDKSDSNGGTGDEERGFLRALGDWGTVIAATSVLSFLAAGGILGYRSRSARDPKRRQMEMLKNIKARHAADPGTPPRIELGPMARFAGTGRPSERKAAVPEQVR